MTPVLLNDLLFEQAKCLAEETAISEHEALQIVKRAGFDIRALRWEARIFKQSKRLRAAREAFD
ncbi:hypothetical protein [Mesorhizobium sp. CN2-181]|uniref:hypothetical protein n=1 Tax=Mesorhizobium yinganensis TaxID=3157707 RepID=UPI0032B87E6D